MVSRMIGCLGVNTGEPSWPTGYESGFVGLHQVSNLVEARVARPTCGRRVLHGIWHGWITAVGEDPFDDGQTLLLHVGLVPHFTEGGPCQPVQDGGIDIGAADERVCPGSMCQQPLCRFESTMQASV